MAEGKKKRRRREGCFQEARKRQRGFVGGFSCTNNKNCQKDVVRRPSAGGGRVRRLDEQPQQFYNIGYIGYIGYSGYSGGYIGYGYIGYGYISSGYSGYIGYSGYNNGYSSGYDIGHSDRG